MRADVIQFFTEYKTGMKAGPNEIVALLDSVKRNNETAGALGRTPGEAAQIATAWGFSAQAMIGIQDIYGQLIAGSFTKDDLENSLVLFGHDNTPFYLTFDDVADSLGF